jgi:hypothetical protein
MYSLTRGEILRGVANRFVHSRTYIFFYLGMAALSVTTVVLSLSDGCPGLPFYILEVIINSAMILEVGVRFVAFGHVSLRVGKMGAVAYRCDICAAILEITVQCCRPCSYGILRHYVACPGICQMWSWKQGGRSFGYVTVGCAECSSVWTVSGSDATVSKTGSIC